MFTLTHKDKKTKARIGILKTKKGAVETPFFMPVATKGNTKFFTSENLKAIGANVVISNALILSLRPGLNVLKKFGGIGKFMNYHGVNFTDSGGFQMYSKYIYISSNDHGVTFRNPFSGEKLLITPEKDMKIQIDINSDVAMSLDSMPMYEHSKKDIEEATRKTILWAERCKREHDKLQKNKKQDKRQLLFGIIQGGIYKDLREKCTKELLKLDFDGYSIGGFGLGETIKEEFDIVKLCKSLLPENKPIYLMGIGNPVEILEGISHGCDIFDSRMPTQNARRGLLFTSKGKLRIMRKEHESSKEPIDANCDCYVCKNYSRSYLRHMLMQDEGTGKILVTFHNLYYLQDLVRKAKEHIKNGTFNKFLEKVKKAYKE
jgi:queuine tRNA-ribosyltransferase